jgi:spermidine/putrescine transport system ATP-binding protein
MSADVEHDHVTIRFGDFIAVNDADLRVETGEFFSFLGPSGCGKTTILRTISGFLTPSEGEIRIGGRNMLGIGPNKRPTALIFQNLALFPLMTVAENITYGLRVRGVPSAERRRKADELLDLIALPGHGDKKVGELSGGQRQRVAIARALAVEPAVLLLDEPLSALDLKLRQHMRTELRAIQQRVGITFIYITHDQGEALTMSDRIAVMSHGIVQQVDYGAAVYDDPATSFVASFVGANNAFFGRISQTDGAHATIDTESGPLVGRNTRRLQTGEKAIVFVRPEALVVGAGAAGGANLVGGTVSNLEFEGPTVNLYLRTQGNRQIMLTLPHNGGSPPLGIGEDATVSFEPRRAVVLPEGELAGE